jgi:hypothetical protein
MSIDLDSILSRVRLTAGHTAVVLLMPHEALALVAEVERLRGENSKLRDTLGWVETQCPGKCAGVCFDALSGEHRKEKE